MLNIKEFIYKARENLAGKNVRRLAMIHAGVTVAAGLLITLLQYVLAEGMGNTSGLSGMGTRSIWRQGRPCCSGLIWCCCLFGIWAFCMLLCSGYGEITRQAEIC